MENGAFIKADKTTVEEWLDEWLKYYVNPSTKENTKYNYKVTADRHLKPYIGSVQLDKLTTDMIQRLFVNQFSELSLRGIRLIRFVLGSSLEQAVISGKIRRNPIRGIRLPRKEAPDMVDPLSPEEVEQLLTANEDHRLYPLLVAALLTGMRRGELLGLKWDNVDLDNNIISVEESLIEVAGKRHVDTPKTKSSCAKVPINERLREVLLEHKEKQANAKKYARSVDLGLVFPGIYGQYMVPRRFSRVFADMVAAAGIRKIRFHDLRHTFAYLLILQNTNIKVIQELMRHADIRTTMNVYGKLLPEVKADAVNNLTEFFKAKTNKEEPQQVCHLRLV